MSGTGPQALATVLIGQGKLFREGLSWVLEKTDIHIVASASRVEDLVLDSALQHQPLLLLIDASGDLDAVIRQIDLFKQRHPAARVAALAASERFGDMVSLCRAGANAYLARGTTSDILIKSLELVMLGATLLPGGSLRNIPVRRGDPDRVEGETSDARTLSTQEKCVLWDLANGRSNRDIAARNDMTLANVKGAVKAILGKIGARNRTQAAIWTVNNLPPDGATESRPPAPHLATAQPSLPGDAAHGERPGQGVRPGDGERPRHGELPGGEATPPARTVGEISVGISTQDETKRVIRDHSLQQERARRELRRIVEDEERQAAMAAKTCRLRELREARDAGSFAASTAVGSSAR